MIAFGTSNVEPTIQPTSPYRCTDHLHESTDIVATYYPIYFHILPT
jgi:hypothetical protein